jgi:hypothetical protein
VEPMGLIDVAGRSDPVDVYRLVAIEEPDST